ncbi:MAG: VOC family protein [Caulobacteraceae bacterium]|nr:VOC family protein [Caulobacteraceae bacterium]
MTARMTLFPLTHQISYVTPDLDAGVTAFQERFGVERFYLRDQSADGRAIRRMALSYVDGFMLELIEPNPAAPGIFAVPSETPVGSAVFHHASHGLCEEDECRMVDDFVEANALPVPAGGQPNPNQRFWFVDARPDFGHFLEFSYRKGRRTPEWDIPDNLSPEARNTPMFGGFMQRAYVTRDIDKAMRRFSDVYGVTRFFERRGAATPASPIRNMALAWTGRVMLELIEPNPDLPTFYDCALPAPGETTRFHHLAFLTADETAYARVREQLKALGLPIVADARSPVGLSFMYADARRYLGHHLEYFHLAPEGRAFFDSIPQN